MLRERNKWKVFLARYNVALGKPKTLAAGTTVGRTAPSGNVYFLFSHTWYQVYNTTKLERTDKWPSRLRTLPEYLIFN